jgi:hypothetical protein
MAGSLGGEGGNFDTIVFTSCNMIGSCARCADFSRAVEWIRAADRFIKRYGCPFLFVYCRTPYGSVLIASRLGPSRGRAADCVAESEQSQSAVHSSARTTLAALRLAQGRVEEAEGLIAGIAEQSPAVAAGIHVARGRAASAAAAAKRGLDTTPWTDQLTTALLVELLAEAEIANGERRAAAARGRELMTTGSARDCPLIAARGLRIVGHAEKSLKYLGRLSPSSPGSACRTRPPGVA